MSRRRVAIVGAGIGSEHLDGWLADARRVEVATICDLDRARAAPLVERARAAGCDARFEAAFERVLADDSIDVIDVCLPPRLHLDAILRSLAAGRHTVCEKPLVASLAQLDEVATAAAGADRLVMPVFQYRFGGGLERLCRLIDAGLAGRAFVATLETHWNREADYYAVPWRGRWDTELGGAIVGHAIHVHDLVVRALGPVASVQASLATRVNPIEVEDCAAIALTMASGALVTSSVTLGASDDRSRLRFCFERLSAESTLDAYNPAAGDWRFEARAPADERAARQADIDEVLDACPVHPDRFARQFGLFEDALANGTEPPVTIADARSSLELVTAMYASHESGTRVTLPLAPGTAGYADWRPSPGRAAPT